ncbi:MAG: hypothetical protein HY535_02520 [Chloroflexi bacterium]|nr:hypothetical protein [Chloroflexota bacterium]
MRHSWVVGALLGVCLMILACGTEQSVHGLVIEVRGRDITQVAAFTLQEQGSGRRWAFEAQGPIGFTPSHLREHMLGGQPVTVWYRKEAGKLVATRVAD